MLLWLSRRAATLTGRFCSVCRSFLSMSLASCWSLRDPSTVGPEKLPIFVQGGRRASIPSGTSSIQESIHVTFSANAVGINLVFARTVEIKRFFLRSERTRWGRNDETDGADKKSVRDPSESRDVVSVLEKTPEPGQKEGLFIQVTARFVHHSVNRRRRTLSQSLPNLPNIAEARLRRCGHLLCLRHVSDNLVASGCPIASAAISHSPMAFAICRT